MKEVKILRNDLISSQWGSRTHKERFAETFDQVAKGEKLFLVDSSGFLSLAINCGNAAKELDCQVGDEVVIYK